MYARQRGWQALRCRAIRCVRRLRLPLHHTKKCRPTAFSTADQSHLQVSCVICDPQLQHLLATIGGGQERRQGEWAGAGLAWRGSEQVHHLPNLKDFFFTMAAAALCCMPAARQLLTPKMCGPPLQARQAAACGAARPAGEAAAKAGVAPAHLWPGVAAVAAAAQAGGVGAAGRRRSKAAEGGAAGLGAEHPGAEGEGAGAAGARDAQSACRQDVQSAFRQRPS